MFAPTPHNVLRFCFLSGPWNRMLQPLYWSQNLYLPSALRSPGISGTQCAGKCQVFHPAEVSLLPAWRAPPGSLLAVLTTNYLLEAFAPFLCCSPHSGPGVTPEHPRGCSLRMLLLAALQHHLLPPTSLPAGPAGPCSDPEQGVPFPTEATILRRVMHPGA